MHPREPLSFASLAFFLAALLTVAPNKHLFGQQSVAPSPAPPSTMSRSDLPESMNWTAEKDHQNNPAVMPIINGINENLSKLAKDKKIRFLNISDKLADRDGKLFDGIMNPDKLHPALKGYQFWADALKSLFTELLGPPTKEDHAPPPTGDPSAAQ